MISPLNNLRTVGRGDKSIIVEANYQVVIQYQNVFVWDVLHGRDNQGGSVNPSGAFWISLQSTSKII